MHAITLKPVGGNIVSPPNTAAPVSVRSFTSDSAGRWDEFVRREPSASLYHLSGWTRAMERTFGFDPCPVYAERDGKITGVLPLFSIKNWMVGQVLMSTPFAIYGGIAAADQESYVALLNRAKEMAQERGVNYVEFRNRAGDLEPGFNMNSRYVTFTCELDTDPEINFKRLPKDTRYMIRKGQKAGLFVRHGIDQLAEFYRLQAISLRRLGTPLFPKALLTNLLEAFPGQIDLLMTYSGEKPICGVFTFLFSKTVLPHYAGADPDAQRLAGNNFMYWELMKWSAEQGHQYFDFGRSKKGTGAYAFKAQWGMTVTPLPYQILLVRQQSMPDFSPANPRFAKATQLWSRLPLWLTKQVGPHIIRWFP